MAIADCFREGHTVFSCEIFPPKKEGPISTVYETLEGLSQLRPDFISVTYGAGGGPGAGTATVEIAAMVRRYGIQPLAHITCMGAARQQTAALLDRLAGAGVDSVLALRGDRTPGPPPVSDFPHASDLTAFIRSGWDLSVSGACYPEGHFESESLVEDTLNLRKKVEAGAGHLISQLFFDNSAFYAFVERARIAGIGVPIQAGIMPVVNRRQIERMVSLCGASLPPKFARMISRYGDNPQAMRDAGIAYAIDQIVDLVANGVQGIHLYTMNNPQVARRIYDSVQSLL